MSVIETTLAKETIDFRTSQDAIAFISQQRERNEHNFIALLEESLQKAKSIAESIMNKALFRALDWPEDIVSYIKYLKAFSSWIPRQSGDEAWKDPETGHSQEVYDRLCHFYFLIDQKVGTNDNVIVQEIPWFSQWLVGYANLWGSFLNTTESITEESLNSFIKNSPEYRVEDSMIDGKPNNPSGWLTFNQFFARELNPGLRPIADPISNQVVTMPADCTFRKKYDINADSAIEEITVKHTHKFANIKDLLKGSEYADAFANGTFVHYFLGPYSYHRFHTPVAGVVKESYAIQGKVYLEVNLENGEGGAQFDAPDNAEGGYEFNQARGVLTIDTSSSPYGDMGIVAVIPIGMCQVSSVNMIATPDRVFQKGDEFGYFLFGGSDIIVLFQEGKAPIIDETTGYRYYGTSMSVPVDCPK